MGLYINSLQNSEILTSYNFARNANFVFSEIVSIEEYEHIKNEYTEIIQQDEFTIFYINRNIQKHLMLEGLAKKQSYSRKERLRKRCKRCHVRFSVNYSQRIEIHQSSQHP